MRISARDFASSTCCLPDLDQIVIGVTHVAANLHAMVLWLREELGPFASPLLVRGSDVCNTNIHEAGNLIQTLRDVQSDGWFIVGWAATDVQNQPTISNAEDGGFATADKSASKNAQIKLRRSLHICNRQEVCEDKAFFGRQLKVFTCRHDLFPCKNSDWSRARSQNILYVSSLSRNAHQRCRAYQLSRRTRRITGSD